MGGGGAAASFIFSSFLSAAVTAAVGRECGHSRGVASPGVLSLNPLSLCLPAAPFRRGSFCDGAGVIGGVSLRPASRLLPRDPFLVAGVTRGTGLAVFDSESVEHTPAAEGETGQSTLSGRPGDASEPAEESALRGTPQPRETLGGCGAKFLRTGAVVTAAVWPSSAEPSRGRRAGADGLEGGKKFATACSVASSTSTRATDSEATDSFFKVASLAEAAAAAAAFLRLSLFMSFFTWFLGCLKPPRPWSASAAVADRKDVPPPAASAHDISPA